MRYEKQHQRGAFTHPDPQLRREAIELTKEGARWALKLGANELVIWSAFDGYDYHHQVNYTELWSRVVDAFQEICDDFPDVRVSLEFKATDENTRFFAVPSTGAALLLAHHIDRSNFGLTLDIGHMIMAGENPAQSVALVGNAGKLFGVQLNDGHAKLGAEDGLMFGSVHSAMALEFVYWLHKVHSASRSHGINTSNLPSLNGICCHHCRYDSMAMCILIPFLEMRTLYVKLSGTFDG